MFEVTEVSIAELRAALESGQTTAVELVQAYLARIDAYDGPDTTTALNAVVDRMWPNQARKDRLAAQEEQEPVMKAESDSGSSMCHSRRGSRPTEPYVFLYKKKE